MSLATAPTTKPRIVCIDDEPNVLASITLNVRKYFEVLTATCGEAGLNLLATEPNIAVVMCDMRMPKLDGAATLARACERHPTVTRILLTGQADMTSAAMAINQGQIFRFLTKPCEPNTLLSSLTAAVAQNRLVTAERELLQSTLRGAVNALVDVLSLTNPTAFGRSHRIKQRALALAGVLELGETWPLEIAASLQDVGYIALPDETLERLRAGHMLSPAEEKMVAGTPAVTEQLLAHIPRLEPVREILAIAGRPSPPRSSGSTGEMFGTILRMAVELDALSQTGTADLDTVPILRGRGYFDERLVGALVRLFEHATPERIIVEVPLAQLSVGMLIAEDVKLSTGALLVPAGYVITPSFIARVMNFPEGVVRAHLRVSVAA